MGICPCEACERLQLAPRQMKSFLTVEMLCIETRKKTFESEVV